MYNTTLNKSAHLHIKQTCITTVHFYDTVTFPNGENTLYPTHLVKCKQVLLKSLACFSVLWLTFLQFQPSQNSFHS